MQANPFETSDQRTKRMAKFMLTSLLIHNKQYYTGLIVDNTGAISIFETEVRHSIATTNALPKELQDLFSMETITVDGENRIIINWQ